MTTSRRGMGELEAEVMAILWDADEWMTPRAVLFTERKTACPDVREPSQQNLSVAPQPGIRSSEPIAEIIAIRPMLLIGL